MMAAALTERLGRTLRDAYRGYGWDALAILGGRVLQNLNGLLLSVAIVRLFGLATLGTQTIAGVAVIVMALVGSFGLPYVLAREAIPLARRNAIGLIGALAAIPANVAVAAVLGLAMGHSTEEATAIMLLGLGGMYFAQTNILTALQVIQRQAAFSIVPPVLNLFGLVTAWLFAGDLVTFAVILVVFRLVGALLPFAFLPYAVPLRAECVNLMRKGWSFIAADGLALAAEQACILALAHILTRSDLGTLGLCRQVITTADTPGWSQSQARYPALARDPAGTLDGFVSHLFRTGLVLAVVLALACVPVALLLFDAPAFAVLGPLLLISLPARYLLLGYDVALRAAGHTRAIFRLSIIRAVAVLALPIAGALVGDASGTVIGMILSTIVAMLASRTVCLNLIARPATDPVGSKVPA